MVRSRPRMARGLMRGMLLGRVVLAVVLGWAGRRGLAAVVWLVIVLLVPASVAAHQLYVFAQAEGRTIRGEAYFRGHIPAQDLPVRIFDPAGRELGQTVTDEEGRFTFAAQEQCDHRLVVASADGHQAEYVLSAAELAGTGPPAGLPGSEQTPAGPPVPGEAADSDPSAGAVEQGQQARSLPAESANLVARIEALQSQVGALRRELSQYEQTIRLRDVLGGIGYIAGLAGVAFYFLGVRRNQQGEGRKDH